MRQHVRRLAYAVAPRLATAISSARGRAHFHRLVEGWGCREDTDRLIARFGDVVQEGPFAGLVLTPATRADHLGPYLLGVYESELDPVWDVVLRRSFAQVVDIGAKFGYYAVGLARRYPDARVIAFDTDWWARRALREMAAANRTPRLEVRGFCDRDWLQREVADGALVISDCEGYEHRLFGDGAVGRLGSAVLIIETHDDLVPGVSSRLRERLAPTHAVRVVASSESRRTSTRELDCVPAARRHLANFEVRPPQQWLACFPREGPHAPPPATW